MSGPNNLESMLIENNENLMPWRQRIMKQSLLFLAAAMVIFCFPNYSEASVSIEASIATGYNSNAYRAPDNEYIDYYQSDNPTISPETYEGFYTPVEFEVSNDSKISRSLRGILNYDFSGNYYIDPDSQNADTYRHKVAAKLKYILAKNASKTDAICLRPFYKYYHKYYNDRDTGKRKVSREGDDLSDGDIYHAYGVAIEFDMRTTSIQYGLDASYENRDYRDPGVYSQDDFAFYSAGGYIRLPAMDSIRIKLSYAFSRKQYDELLSRNEIGKLSASNPRRDLEYHKLGILAKFRLAKKVSLYAGYDFRRRLDSFQGYHDYTKHNYAIRAIYSYNKIKFRGKLAYWTRDYDKAYAFNDPNQGDLAYDGIKATVGAEYEYSDGWTVTAKVRYDDENSTDNRYTYDRYQVIVGFKWEY